MSDSESLCGCLGFEIGFNCLRPQAEPYENMRGHVLRVSRCGSNRCIAACSRKSQVREGWIVVSMNEVMSDSGMSWLARENAIQYFRGFFLLRITFVAHHGSGSDE